MKFNKYLLLVGLVITSKVALAVTFNVNLSNQSTLTGPLLGATTRSASFVNDGVNGYIYTLDFAGNLDGLGTSDDTLQVIVRQQRQNALGGNLTLAGTTASIGGSLADGETFLFSIDSISYSRGEGFTNTTTFNGFQGLTMLGTQGGATHFGYRDAAKTISWSGVHGNQISVPNETGTLYITSDSTATTVPSDTPATNTFFRSLQFSVDLDDSTVAAVPEPSSMALLALGLTSLIFARRRKI